ncbi:MAG TPA: MOSC N-terminal beta barrel domain-containing protein [Thermoanaerobaculaceae bacterium]|nr:MOSC N-terminal beta barrel domain-containing protein [Thermoanaerobaculaceae bacterium]
MSALELSGLNVYPVKSARGVACASATVGPRGLDGDRRWMVVEGERVFLSQRTRPRLALVSVAQTGSHLVLSAPGTEPLTLARPPEDAATVRVRVWDDVCDAQPAPHGASGWISAVLGCACELVFMPDASHRAVERRGAAPDAEVGFADSYPFLLISEASLADLNRRLARPVEMNRFRPNLVVRGCAPYAEDGWRRIRIGQVVFHVVKPCSRCATTTVDQATAERGREPLATLATYRRVGDKVMFGQNLVHEGGGALRVGDEVTVLERS